MRSFSPRPLAFVLAITFTSFLTGAIVEAELPTLGKNLLISAVCYRFWMVLEWARLVQDTSSNKNVILFHLLLRILAFGASIPGLQLTLQLNRLLVGALRKSI